MRAALRGYLRDMRKHILIVLGLIVLVVIAGAVYVGWPDTAKLPFEQVTGRRPAISEPRIQTIPTVKVADVVGWRGGATPVAAAGLTVRPFATDLAHPRWLYRLPNGDVLVAETNSPPRKGGGIQGFVMKLLMGKAGAGVASANRITLLRDSDGDGVADQRSVFMTGLRSPMGMTLMGGMLYVANTDSIVRVPYTDGMTKISAKPELVVRLNGGGNHWGRTLIPNTDGKTLLVGVGSSSNIADNGIDAEKFRANILQVWPKEKTFRIYAAGLRNPQGMAINPINNQLWTVVNERDMLGSDLAPAYLTSGRIWRSFRLALVLLGRLSRHPGRTGQPAAPAICEAPRLRAGAACRRARARLFARCEARRSFRDRRVRRRTRIVEPQAGIGLQGRVRAVRGERISCARRQAGRRADRLPRQGRQGAGPPGRCDHRQDRRAAGGGRCRQPHLACQRSALKPIPSGQMRAGIHAAAEFDGVDCGTVDAGTSPA